MKQTEQRMKTQWILVFLAMLVCFCGWWAVRKEGFFADELYSYGLSNSDYAPFLSWYYNGERAYSGTSAEHIYSREDFMSYVAVQEGQRFDYASVYYNQTQDVHPPVFYFLLHTVCSLFPGSFTKWTGLGLILRCSAAPLRHCMHLAWRFLKGRTVGKSRCSSARCMHSVERQSQMQR